MNEVIAVANEFIARGQRAGVRDLNAAKLHAMVYLVCCYWQAHQGEIGARIMADSDGVYLADLRELGCWGTRRIEEPLSIFVTSSTSEAALHMHVPQLAANAPVRPTLDWVWRTRHRMSPYELTRLTREPGTPWDRVWNSPSRNGNEAREVPARLLQQWFDEQMSISLGVDRVALTQPQPATAARVHAPLTEQLLRA